MIGESFLNGRVFLNHGDNREVLRSLPDNSIDAIVTDPPYALTSIVKRFGKAGAAPAKKGKGKSATGAYARASAGFMGQHWDTGETAFAIEFWAECFRVLKPGGHVAAFSGTRTQHRMTIAIEDAGFEIRDDILRMLDSAEPWRLFMNSLDDAQRSALVALMDEASPTGLAAWAYGTGFPKSHDVSKALDKHLGAARAKVRIPASAVANTKARQDSRPYIEAAKAAGYHEIDGDQAVTPQALAAAGFGTALKPAWEPIILARKPLIGSVAENWIAHGTGGINVDGCRVEGGERQLVVCDRRDGNNTYGPGLAGSRAAGMTTTGRHPANIIHDGSAEVMAAFPDAPGQQAAPRADGAPKAGSIYGRMSHPTPGSMWAIGGERSSVPGGPIYGDAGGSAARFFYSSKADADDRIGSRHPTVKPVELMMWVVRLVTPKGGLVLDPFAGSGSTGEAAWAEGMRCILIEREAKFCEDIRRRLNLVMCGPDERQREAIKANGKAKALDVETDEIPLFKVLV